MKTKQKKDKAVQEGADSVAKMRNDKKGSIKSCLLWCFPGMAVLAADRLTKALWGETEAVLIPGIIGLHPARNTGMAMGLLSDQTVLVLVLSVILASLAALLLRGKSVKGLACIALSMIAGGALGNVIDRLTQGFVTDMIELLFMDFYIVNVADAGVVTGVILCGFSLLFRPGDWRDA